MEKSALTIGIIGYRGFGAFCTEAFNQSGVAKVVAYSGRDAEAMSETAQRYDVERTYTDWTKLIADPDVQLVHIVTPPDLHATMAVAALRAGKHVLIEKPLALTKTEAMAIELAEEESGKIAGINYVMRHNPLYQKVARIAHTGILGKLTHVAFENYASDEGLGDTHWFWDPEQSGGIFVEHGVHFFDIIGHVIDAPAEHVLAQTWARNDGTNKEDRVHALVTYANGTTASYYHAFNRPGILEQQLAHFAFEKGHVLLRGWIPTTLTLDAIVDDNDKTLLTGLFDNLETLEDDLASVRGNGKSYRVRHHVTASIDLGEPNEVYQSAVQSVIRDIVDAIQAAGQHRMLATIADGATSLDVALAAHRSATSHAIVRIK
jgi:predicted dehydrogenase